METYAWLIECRRESFETEYLAINGSYDGCAGNGVFGWSLSPYDALRFSRKEDAAKFLVAIRSYSDNLPHVKTIKGLRESDSLPSISEHKWG